MFKSLPQFPHLLPVHLFIGICLHIQILADSQRNFPYGRPALRRIYVWVYIKCFLKCCSYLFKLFFIITCFNIFSDIYALTGKL